MLPLELGEEEHERICNFQLHDNEKAGIIDTFYGRYEDRVAKSPEGHAMDYVHVYLICSKA